MHDANVDTDEDTPLACTVSVESKVGRWRGAYTFASELSGLRTHTRGDGGRVHTRKAKASKQKRRGSCAVGAPRADAALPRFVPMLLCGVAVGRLFQ